MPKSHRSRAKSLLPSFIAFPVYLPANIIENFSQENGIVLDCFGGTGTTLIAAEQLNRTCYMMELDPKYCDVIIDRWEMLTGEKAAILRRYVENTGDAENVYCIRNGQKVAYADVVKQVDRNLI